MKDWPGGRNGPAGVVGKNQDHRQPVSQQATNKEN